ncbi:MAG: hypothetical protein ACFFD4_03245 [Candidatus Odinarchaeota archaeon]
MKLSVVKALSSSDFILEEILEMIEIESERYFVHNAAVKDNHRLVVDNRVAVSNCERIRKKGIFN